MIALSRFSDPAVYVASIVIHVSGTVLLFQYLLTRDTCTRSHYPPQRARTNDMTQSFDRLRGLSHRPLSEYSVTSEDFTRKRRRPYTTYGGGDEYLRQLRRGSLDLTAEATMSAWLGPRADRTASGRRIPRRSVSVGSSSHVSGSLEMRRSRSLSSADRRPLMRGEEAKSSGSGSGKEKERPPLRRTKSGSIFRENFDDVQRTEREVSAPLGSGSSSQMSQEQESTVSVLKPILLPPLRNPLQSAAAIRAQTEMEEAASRPQSRPRSASVSGEPPLRVSLITSPSESGTDTSSESASSNFTFPFASQSQSSQARLVQYEEDFAHWRAQNVSMTSTLLSQPGPHTWPVGPADLLEPDPPFAMEDRPYVATPTESRLSTITEEGTIRESMTTPTNIHLAEILSAMRASPSEEGAARATTPTMPRWVTHGTEAEMQRERAPSRLSNHPLAESTSSEYLSANDEI
jgi:hypothetical protein